MTGDVACWEAAHDGAERLLGAQQGGRVVSALVGVMRAIRRERAVDWRFMPATCCRVTGDERDLVALLGETRRGARSTLTDRADALAGADAPGLAAAIWHAVVALEEAAPRLVRPPARSVLH